MTVEDPIEFLHKHKKCIVNQREVGADTHGFGQALKHVLRQDPDVILVGEMRDLETISTAITAAETGHLVFATLHTQDAPQTIDRIIDVFPPHQQQQVRVQLATTLQGVVTQQLLQTADGQGRVVACGGPGHHPGDPQPDPRGQGPPDLLGDAGRRPLRDADDGHVDRRAREGRPDQRSRWRSSDATTPRSSSGSWVGAALQPGDDGGGGACRWAAMMIGRRSMSDTYSTRSAIDRGTSSAGRWSRTTSAWSWSACARWATRPLEVGKEKKGLNLEINIRPGEGQAEGGRDLLPAVRHHGQLGPADPARACRSWPSRQTTRSSPRS